MGRLVWHGMGTAKPTGGQSGGHWWVQGRQQISAGCGDGQMVWPGRLVMPMCDCADGRSQKGAWLGRCAVPRPGRAPSV